MYIYIVYIIYLYTYIYIVYMVDIKYNIQSSIYYYICDYRQDIYDI